jgi:hypothetical protein
MTNLENVKVGEMVYFRSGMGTAIYLCKIDRVTDTLVISGKDRFNRSSGKKQGTSGWYQVHAYPATPEIIREYKTDRMRRKIKHYIESGELQKLPLESLEMIYNSFPISKVEKEDDGESKKAIKKERQ